MENQEYLLLIHLTRKENRKNLIKVILGGAAFVAIVIASMYFFLYFRLWANEISEKIVGIIS